jgi:hypothetical protein
MFVLLMCLWCISPIPVPVPINRSVEFLTFSIHATDCEQKPITTSYYDKTNMTILSDTTAELCMNEKCIAIYNNICYQSKEIGLFLFRWNVYKKDAILPSFKTLGIIAICYFLLVSVCLYLWLQRWKRLHFSLSFPTDSTFLLALPVTNRERERNYQLGITI